jgi:hypothetical protein
MPTEKPKLVASGRLSWSVPRLAQAYDVSERFVWKKIAAKELPVVRIGRRTLVRDEAARKFLGLVEEEAL